MAPPCPGDSMELRFVHPDEPWEYAVCVPTGAFMYQFYFDDIMWCKVGNAWCCARFKNIKAEVEQGRDVYICPLGKCCSTEHPPEWQPEGTEDVDDDEGLQGFGVVYFWLGDDPFRWLADVRIRMAQHELFLRCWASNYVGGTFGQLQAVNQRNDIAGLWIEGHGNSTASGDAAFVVSTDRRYYWAARDSSTHQSDWTRLPARSRRLIREFSACHCIDETNPRGQVRLTYGEVLGISYHKVALCPTDRRGNTTYWSGRRRMAQFLERFPYMCDVV